MKAAPLLAAAAALAGCDMTPPAAEGETGIAHLDAAEIAPAGEAARTAHLAAVDPAVLGEAEIEKVLPPGPGCAFSYTEASGPILVARAPQGAPAPLPAVIKLNGRLVALSSRKAGVEASLVAGPIVFGADDVRAGIFPLAGENVEEKRGLRQWQADLHFRVGKALQAGYRGFWTCGAAPGRAAVN